MIELWPRIINQLFTPLTMYNMRLGLGTGLAAFFSRALVEELLGQEQDVASKVLRE